MSALGVTYPLNNDLLGGLGRNPAEVGIFDDLLVHIPGLQVGVHFSGFLGGELGTEQGQFGIGHHQPAPASDIFAALTINGYLDVGLFVVAFLRCGCQSQLNRLKNNILSDTFFC